MNNIQKGRDYSAIDWGYYFAYNPDTGKLHWKVKRYKKAIQVGDEAGSYTGKYAQVGLLGDVWLIHRVIWCIVYGSIPVEKEIDHIDRDPSNNKLENLRIVSRRENSFNRGRPANNTSGVIGVGWCKQTEKYKATIRVKSKLIHLGYFEDKKDAIAARKEAKIKYKFTADAVGG